MSDTLAAELQSQKDDSAALKSAVASVVQAIGDLSNQLAAALANAANSGTDPAILQGFADVDAGMKQMTADLNTAVGNATAPVTSPAPTPAPPPAPPPDGTTPTP